MSQNVPLWSLLNKKKKKKKLNYRSGERRLSAVHWKNVRTEEITVHVFLPERQRGEERLHLCKASHRLMSREEVEFPPQWLINLTNAAHWASRNKWRCKSFKAEKQSFMPSLHVFTFFRNVWLNNTSSDKDADLLALLFIWLRGYEMIWTFYTSMGLHKSNE